MIGTKVGAYQITGLLGEGGMGSVWNATHSLMGREAVIKFLKPELSFQEEMIRRFFNEARAAASIEDPGIVNVFDVGKLDNGCAFIVMERLRGQSLADRLRQRRLRVEECALILRLLARSLGAAHANGIVHRDLKPDNIFLCPDRDVPGGERTKILDFGIAKLAGGATMATRAGSIFGTPAYMAPEQCNDSAAVDGRADLYALGCIAYEMMSGAPPFGLGGLEVLAAHMRDEPVPLSSRVPGLVPGFDAVIHRLLAKDPAARYASCAELIAAIDAVRIPSGILSAATVAAPTPLPFAAQPMPVASSTPMPVASPTPMPVASPTPYIPPTMTTHTAASGMVSAPTAPPIAPRRHGLAIGIAVGLGIVVLGGVALFTLRGKSAASGKQLSASEQLEIAEAAFRDERWDDAMLGAMKVLAIDEKHERAKALAEEARVEGEHAQAWKRMQKGAGVDDFPALAAAFAEIGDDSAYSDRATELRSKEQGEWLDVELPKLAALAASGDCAEHGRLLASIDHWVLPGEPRLDAEARACDVGAAVAIDAGVAVAVVTPDDTHDRKVKTKKDPPKEVVTPVPDVKEVKEVKRDPPPDEEEAASDPDAAMVTARDALKNKHYREALKSAEQVLAARGDAEAQMIATVAACGLGNLTKAKKHLPSGRSSYREISIHRCSVLGIELD